MAESEEQATAPVWQQLVKQARERVREAGYPIPSKPTTPLEELRAPEDVEGLGAVQLANLLLRYQAWHSYVTAHLAFARADLAAFQEFYEVELGNRMHSIAMHEESKQTKDVLKALALRRDPMVSLHHKKVELELRVRTVEGLSQSLEVQCRALTNEQIRRHAAQKLEGGYGGGNF